MTSPVGYVYVLRFSQSLGSEKHSARYYIGWAKHLDLRIAHHRAGNGSAITRAAVQRGFEIELVYSFPGTKTDERQLKNRKNMPRIVRQWQRQGLIPCPA